MTFDIDDTLHAMTLTLGAVPKASPRSIYHRKEERPIMFAKGAQYALIKAVMYGGKGYLTYKTDQAVLEQAEVMDINGHSYMIIDREGNIYERVADKGGEHTLQLSDEQDLKVLAIQEN